MGGFLKKARDWIAGKSMKREIAALAFVVWLLIVHRIFWQLDPDKLHSFLPFFDTITMWVFLLTAAAFGMHAMLKQSSVFSKTAEIKPEPPKAADGEE